MARPHHRKKHKQHLQQFKQSHETTTSVKSKKGKASGVFAFGGVAVGLLLGYLASNGSVIWAASGLVAGGIAGYLIGRSVDGSDK